MLSVWIQSFPRIRSNLYLWYTPALSAALCFLLLWHLFPGNSTFGQTPGISGLNIAIRRISLEPLVATHVVLSLIQDRRGFLWVGTQDALCRYDGSTFRGYQNHDRPSSGDNIVSALCEDSEGAIWAGTKAGLCRYDPVEETSRRMLHDPADSSSLSNDDVRCILEDRAGDLWVGTMRGLNRLNRRNGTWTHYLPNRNATALPGDNCITTILEDRDGRFWIGTGDYLLQGGGLFVLDRTSGQFTPVGPRVRVLTLFESASRDLWVSFAGPRLMRRDRGPGVSTRLTSLRKSRGIPVSRGSDPSPKTGQGPCGWRPGGGACSGTTNGPGSLNAIHRKGTTPPASPRRRSTSRSQTVPGSCGWGWNEAG